MPKQKSLELQEVDPALKKIKVNWTRRNAIMKALMERHKDLFVVINNEIAEAAQKFIDANYIDVLPTPEHQAAAELMMDAKLLDDSTEIRFLQFCTNERALDENFGLRQWRSLYQRVFGSACSLIEFPLQSYQAVKRYPRVLLKRGYREIKGVAVLEKAIEKILANHLVKAVDAMLMIEAALKSARTVYDIAVAIPELKELAMQLCSHSPVNTLPAVVDAKQVRSYLKSIEPLVDPKPAESADAAQVAALAMGAA